MSRLKSETIPTRGIQYNEEFVRNVKNAFPTTKIVHEAALEGSVYLGKILYSYQATNKNSNYNYLFMTWLNDYKKAALVEVDSLIKETPELPSNMKKIQSLRNLKDFYISFD